MRDAWIPAAIERQQARDVARHFREDDEVENEWWEKRREKKVNERQCAENIERAKGLMYRLETILRAEHRLDYGEITLAYSYIAGLQCGLNAAIIGGNSAIDLETQIEAWEEYCQGELGEEWRK